MKPTFALLLLLAAAPLFSDQTLFFMQDDLSVVTIAAPDPPAACDPEAQLRADCDFQRFQALSDDERLPPPLDYLAREAWSRYAILGYGFPSCWTARDVREVFLTCDELRTFMIAHYARS